MTPPPDALFVDALSGADGTADVAPARSTGERFDDPLLAPLAQPQPRRIRLPALPVVELEPPDPRDFMSHLAERDDVMSSAPAPARPPAVTQLPAARVAAAAPAPRYSGPPSGPVAPPPAASAWQAGWQAPVMPPPARQASPAWQPPAVPVRVPTPARPTVRDRRSLPPRAVPPALRQPMPPVRVRQPRKKSGGGWTVLFVLIAFLVFSGLGRQVLDALMEIFNR